MNKQIISKTLLMTGLVMLAANASANSCANKQVGSCTDLRVTDITAKKSSDEKKKSSDEKKLRRAHCESYYEAVNQKIHANCTYKSGATCTTGKICKK